MTDQSRTPISVEWIGAIERGDITSTDRKVIAQHLREAADLRERLAGLTMSLGFATGHGDTAADILKELEWQIEERLAKARAEAIEELIQLCRDFSSRNGSIYIRDVESALSQIAPRPPQRRRSWQWIRNARRW